MGALEALERNDVSRLPGGIFSRAFVRSYAIEVGLEPEDVRDSSPEFPHDAAAAGHPTTEHVDDNEALESDRRMATAVLRLIGRHPGRRRGAVSRPSPTVASLHHPSRRAMRPPGCLSLPGAPVSAAEPAIAVRVEEADTNSPALAVGPVQRPAAVEPAAGHLTIVLLATAPCAVSATVDGKRAVERGLQAGGTRAAWKRSGAGSGRRKRRRSDRDD